MRIRTKVAALAAAVIAILVGATGANAITNGQPDGTNHPYVGVMIAVDSDGAAWLCSGSLLHEDVFLTAAHCTEGAIVAFVWFDEKLPTPLTAASADAVGTAWTHPDFCSPCEHGLPGFSHRDVGIVTLDVIQHPLPTEFANLPTSGQVDSLENKSAIDFVGYGVTHQDRIPGKYVPKPPPLFRWTGDGTRMYAPGQTVSGQSATNAEFMKVTSSAAKGRGGTCFGDSGGPNLLGTTDTVLAVTSYGPDPNCSAPSYSQRIDIPDVLDWIESFLA